MSRILTSGTGAGTGEDDAAESRRDTIAGNLDSTRTHADANPWVAQEPKRNKVRRRLRSVFGPNDSTVQ